MTLVGIIGELGAGKTLGLTYLLWRNHNNFCPVCKIIFPKKIKLCPNKRKHPVRKGRKIYSNFHLNDIDYSYVNSIEDIDNMTSGVFGGDELWSWLDSRASKNKVNLAISSILLKSRKRSLEIIYTTQSFSQIDKRIRNITDFIVEPILTRNETMCRLYWYNKSMWLIGTTPMKIMRFHAAPVFELYDTKEEIRSIVNE